jgi:teichuronic acid biosynthesis glycosyltransferase TuaG
VKTHLPFAPVSVVIPCYKCAKTIHRAINSIVAQTFQPKEIILIDDFSSDGTLNHLTELSNQYAGWIRVIPLASNVGAAKARNVGRENATQPLVALLDADDAWHQRKIETQYKHMEAHPEVSMCVHLHRETKVINTTLDWSLPALTFWRLTALPALVKNQFITPSFMIRNSLPVRFRNEQRYMEDQYFIFEVICDGHRVDVLPLELAAIYKPAFGASGLSSSLWAMEKGELGNYRRLFTTGRIGVLAVFGLMVLSVLKFGLRLIRVKIRRKFANG